MNDNLGIEKILCSICIATYKRVDLLENLLKSLHQQTLLPNLDVEVIVVDNDSQKSAESVVNKIKPNFGFKLLYFVQPQKNISLTRNLAVGKSSGEYLFFIDDDEIASKDWLVKLIETMEKFDADGVFGYVNPQFQEDVPKWLSNREFYYSTMDITGTKAKHMFTSNCILKSYILKSMDVLFDPDYGITGGEDVHLFSRLEKKGAKFVNCREAVVYEHIGANRGNIRYILKRAMRGGNTFARRSIEAADNISTRIYLFIKSLINICTCILIITIIFPITKYRIKWMIKFAANIGKTLSIIGWNYEGYK